MDNIDLLVDQLIAKESPTIVLISTDKLHPFPAHPFKVQDNEDMEQLTQSIQTQGVLSPLVVRPLPSGEYEVISGHRRLHACKNAGIETVPALIVEWIVMPPLLLWWTAISTGNISCPVKKPSLIKMKLEALNHQGTSGQVGQKWTRDSMARGTDDSSRQIHRYIRLTNLIPGILERVDEGRIALNPAVELSYLTEAQQQDLLEAMGSEDCTPSLSQAIQLKQLSQAGKLDADCIFSILTQLKPNQREKISFRTDEVRKFFPKNFTPAQMQEVILKLLGEYQRKRKRTQER